MSNRECAHSRLIDAPRERLFRAIAGPEHLARWWGPDGFSSSFELFEFRPGGRWRFVMRGPDGRNYPNENRFVEIVAPERVVIEHVADEHHFLLTITLTAEGTRTRVGWRQVFDTAEHRERVAQFVLEANEQNLSRLAAEVENVPLRGSCLCGAVRYEITGSFELIGNCHCRMCRKSNGAAFATWGIVKSDQFRWTTGEQLVQSYESSPGNQRCFCRTCGSPLVAMHGGKVGEVVLGTLDDDPGLRPREHIFVGSKAPWYEIQDALPQSVEWPESLHT